MVEKPYFNETSIILCVSMLLFLNLIREQWSHYYGSHAAMTSITAIPPSIKGSGFPEMKAMLFGKAGRPGIIPWMQGPSPKYFPYHHSIRASDILILHNCIHICNICIYIYILYLCQYVSYHTILGQSNSYNCVCYLILILTAEKSVFCTPYISCESVVGHARLALGETILTTESRCSLIFWPSECSSPKPLHWLWEWVLVYPLATRLQLVSLALRI